MRALAAVLLLAPLVGCLGLGADEPVAPAATNAEEGAPPAAQDPGAPTPRGPSPTTPTPTPARPPPAPPTAVRPSDDAAPPAPPEPRPRVVVAVIDTDVNLYHAEYRRDAPLPPPPGMPEATPVALTLDVSDREAAAEADEAALAALEPRRLYAFPGTKIVGAISFLAPTEDAPLLLAPKDAFSHGTMTTSRAVGNTVSLVAGDVDVDLVFVQGFTVEAVEWVADQDWIDIVSISAGLSPNSAVPLAPNVQDDGAIEAYERLARSRPFFASTGNGVLNAGVAGFPAWLRGASGVPDVISVGANDNDRYTLWHNQDAYVSADGCGNPMAVTDGTSGTVDEGGGTSSATPFAAGGGARILLEARRLLGDTAVGAREGNADAGAWSSGHAGDADVILAQGDATAFDEGPLEDGVFTLLELKDVLYHTALAVPTDDETDGVACAPTGSYGAAVPALDVPPEARFALHGYGEVNVASVGHALTVLAGDESLPRREADDAQYERAYALKRAAVMQEP